jgi:hypothetical protein
VVDLAAVQLRLGLRDLHVLDVRRLVLDLDLGGLLDGDAQGGARLAAPVGTPSVSRRARRPLMLREPAMVESLKKEVEEGYSTVNRRICEPAEWLTATVDVTVAQP